MRLSVVIVNWNTREHLARCLETLQSEGVPGQDSEAIVLDNASRDGSAAMVRDRFPGTVLIAGDVNAGYAAGNNLAAKRAAGRVLLFLNPDVTVHPGSISELTACLERHPRACLAAPRLLLPNGETQASVRGFPDPLPLVGAALNLDRLFPGVAGLASYRRRDFDYTSEQPAPQPMASAWMVPRAAWEDIGPFDTAFPLFWNDVDWCLRACARGWETWYTPDAVMTHVGGASTRQVKPRATWESHRALAALYRKHYARRLGPAGMALAATGIYLAGIIRTAWHAVTRPTATE